MALDRDEKTTPATFALMGATAIAGYVLAYLYLSNVNADTWVYAAPALGPLAASVYFTLAIPIQIMRQMRSGRNSGG